MKIRTIKPLRDPFTHQPITVGEILEVGDQDTFWHRRMLDGDVEVVEAEERAKQQPTPARTPRAREE